MNITKGTGTEVRRFMRSAQTGFDQAAAAHPNTKYNMSFQITLAVPLIEKSDSEVKSYLDKIARAVAVFAETDILTVNVDFAEHNSVQAEIAQRTSEAYEAARSLETPAEGLVAVK